MFVKTVLEWSYTPPDTFEALYVFPSQDFELRIDGGLASVTFKQPRQQVDATERLEVESIVRLAFRGLQAMTHQCIEVTGEKVCQYDAEGQLYEFIFDSGTVCGGSAISIDTIEYTDGNITHDSRAERIQKNHGFVSRVLNHALNDGLLCFLLNSYAAAINDPGNEFLYLCEIREALIVRFGNQTAAQKSLGISKKLWSDFGGITNNEPVDQSRHRGLFIYINRRPATIEELREARRTAQEMIENTLLP
jgi:hypothetical protein